MSESVYKVVELVGTSTESWEKAASAAVERAGQSLRDLRVAEVDELVELGEIAPDDVHLPGLFVQRIFEAPTHRDPSEHRTTRSPA